MRSQDLNNHILLTLANSSPPAMLIHSPAAWSRPTKRSNTWVVLPGTAAGESGPERDWATLAGDPTGDGEGPLMPGRWGEVCGEKGDWAGLLCSPWLLEIPDVLTPGLRAPSVPMGRSSIEPDRSCNTQRNRSGKNKKTWDCSLTYH